MSRTRRTSNGRGNAKAKGADEPKGVERSLLLEPVEIVEPVAEPAVVAADPGYKDELNLAEFPIAALTDRVPDGQLSLVFEDILEQRDGPPIVRRLTIMGTHKHGLPTATDDEVMVGLIQLTKRRNNFTDGKVAFSRYELIELLGWAQSGQSYQRIEEALHRWVGVVLMYENAWWDNAAKSWVDENFHILDNVTLYDRERRRPLSSKKNGGRKGTDRAEVAPLPLSSFRWNEVVFRSFQSGNLKQLDLDFYLSLRLPTTKRLFRFLDKRFYRRERVDFDLKTLACEHIGMTKSYKPTELKRRLQPALGRAGGEGVYRAPGFGGAVFVSAEGGVADPVHPGSVWAGGRACRAGGRGDGLDRGVDGPGRGSQGGGRAGGDSSVEPCADEAGGFRLAFEQ